VIEQGNTVYSVNSIVGQPLIGQSDGQKNSVYNGFVYIPIAFTPVKIQFEPPIRFFVYPPFPNPFNPATTFTISIPRDSHLVLLIYNISGQRVATIADERVRAGRFSISWNAGGMPSGIYFCKAQIENAVDIKKVMLLK
jgi:hypothetical protein